jgi:hypothetical protein
MGCYNQNKKIANLNRPEELVRQKVLHFLTTSLQFPKDLIIIEKKLSDLNASGLSCPLNRRVDILCYANTLEGVVPLLLIECKATSKLSRQHQEQVEGYNQWVQAKFVSVVAKDEACFGFYSAQNQQYVYHEGLVDYLTLIQHIS